MACSLLSSYTLKSLCFRSRTYSPFLFVTTVSTSTKRDSFLITTLLCGSAEFCCGDCGAADEVSFAGASLGASLGASRVGGAGTGAGELFDCALNRPCESSSATVSKNIQLSRLPVVVVFMAIAPDFRINSELLPRHCAPPSAHHHRHGPLIAPCKCRASRHSWISR